MKIDAQVYVGKSLFHYGHKPEALIELLDSLGLDRCILCPVKPRGYHLEPENNYVAELSKRHSDRFIGFVRVDPWLGDAGLEELSRGIELLGLRGLYLNPWEESYQINSEIIYPLMEKAKEYRIPVMIKGGFPVVSQPCQIADIARCFPETTIIATSGGQINICGGALEDARLMLSENKNVYMETSGIYREDFIQEMAEVLSPDRLIFGSSSPLMDMNFELQRVTQAHLDKSAKEKIMGGNLKKILSL